MITKINISEEALAEYYLCGMRTAYTSSEARKVLKHDNEMISNCSYCSSFHIIPKYVDHETLINEARNSFRNFIVDFNATKSARPKTGEFRTLSAETEAVIIQSNN